MAAHLIHGSLKMARGFVYEPAIDTIRLGVWNDQYEDIHGLRWMLPISLDRI